MMPLWYKLRGNKERLWCVYVHVERLWCVYVHVCVCVHLCVCGSRRFVEVGAGEKLPFLQAAFSQDLVSCVCACVLWGDVLSQVGTRQVIPIHNSRTQINHFP